MKKILGYALGIIVIIIGIIVVFPNVVEVDYKSPEKEGGETKTSTEIVNQENKKIDLNNDIFDPLSIAVLVNKQYSLDEDDYPEDLVIVDVLTVLENPEV